MHARPCVREGKEKEIRFVNLSFNSVCNDMSRSKEGRSKVLNGERSISRLPMILSRVRTEMEGACLFIKFVGKLEI